MSFLTPLFLLGGLAIALPILFHLLRRTPRERADFSSLMFLQPTPPRVARRSRLENLWLLVLRCLVLALLAAGFARPFFKKPATANPAAHAGKRAVVLVDASASMRRGDLWAQARAQAADYLRRAEPADQIAVFAFSREVRQIIGFEEWTGTGAGARAELAIQRLGALNPGWGGTRLDQALITAAERLDDTPATIDSAPGRRRQIVLISDRQEGSRLEGLQRFEWPADVELLHESLKAAPDDNAGIQLAGDGSQRATAAAMAPRARIWNAPGSKQEQLFIEWRPAGGVPAAATVPSLPVYVPAGQSRLFTPPPAPGGANGSALVLSGDGIEFDNTAFYIPPEPRHVSVLYLGNETASDSGQPLFYLQRALPPSPSVRVEIVPLTAQTPWPATMTNPVALLIVADLPPPAHRQHLARLLREGKTILVLLKDPQPASLLAELTGLDAVDCEEANTERYAMLGEIDFRHPVFASFADPRFSDFTKVQFWRHRRLDLRHWPNSRTLARFDNGDPALVESSVGPGKLFTLTAGWHPADSQLALSTKFVPWLFALLEAGGDLQVPARQYLVGDTVTPPPAPLEAGQTVRWLKPDGTSTNLPPGAVFTATDQPGLYSAELPGRPFRFAVNLDPLESKTGPMPLDELSRFGVAVKPPKSAAQPVAAPSPRQARALELENRQKLWRWLILATLLAVLAESWLAARIARSPAPQT